VTDGGSAADDVSWTALRAEMCAFLDLGAGAERLFGQLVEERRTLRGRAAVLVHHQYRLAAATP
jgi:hypothetical protein